MFSHPKLISGLEQGIFLSTQRDAIHDRTGHYRYIRPLRHDDDLDRIELLRSELLIPAFRGNSFWRTVKAIPYLIETSYQAFLECIHLEEYKKIELADCLADTNNEKYIALVYNNNDAIIGFACAVKTAAGWSIYDAIIDEQYRGKGIGTAAIHQLLFELEKKAPEPVYMYVDNPYVEDILRKTERFSKKGSFLSTRGKRTYWVMDN